MSNAEIRVFDHNLNFLSVVDNHSSLIWTRRYFEPGEFELHIPITDENLSIFVKGNVVTRKNNHPIMEAGVIEHVEHEKSGVIYQMIVKGRFLSSYLDRRLIKGLYNFNGTVENAMRSIVTNMTEFPLIELGTSNGFTEKVNFQATYKGVLDYEERLARYSGIGFRLRPDLRNKKMIFETYKGSDRSVAQTTLPRVIFSDSYQNLNEVTHMIDDTNLKTYVWIGGEGEGTARTFASVGSGSGFDLREMFVDARDLSSTDLTADAYTALLQQRGREKLAEMIESESVSCELAPNLQFIYQTDYDLGDIVTVRKKDWNVSMNQRLTEIQEIYENGGVKIVPTIGSPLPETIDWSEN